MPPPLFTLFSSFLASYWAFVISGRKQYWQAVHGDARRKRLVDEGRNKLHRVAISDYDEHWIEKEEKKRERAELLLNSRDIAWRMVSFGMADCTRDITSSRSILCHSTKMQFSTEKFINEQHVR